MAIKLTWRVGERPTGRYQSFQRRSWPTAVYHGTDQTAAFISCADSYDAALVKSGLHGPLTVSVADYSKTPWRRVKLVTTFDTLDEAKDSVIRVLTRNPHFCFQK